MPLLQVRPGQEPELAAQLAQEPLFNLLLIGYLAEGLGPHLEVWADGQGGALMRRRARWLVAAGEGFDFAAAAAILDGFGPELVHGLVGRPGAVDPLYAGLQHHSGTLYQQWFAAMESAPAPIACAGTPRPARAADLDTLAGMYADVGVMTRSRSAIERALDSYLVVEDAGRVVSAGWIPTRTGQAGLVGGILTPPELRGRGYATTVVYALSTALLAEDRTPCLFYHNPDAGRIYLRLGYRELGSWRTVSFKD